MSLRVNGVNVNNPPAWDDMRVSASATVEEGSNPPLHAKFKDDGSLVAGSAKSVNFLSNAQGYIKIPSDSTIDFRGSDCSVGIWYHPTLNTPNNARIIGCGSFAVAFYSDLDRLRFYTVQIGNQFSLSNSVNVNEWNRIVVTHKNNVPPYEFTVYINGIQVMQFSQNSLPTSSGDLDINDEKSFGGIDYITLWDKTLTEAEITADYNDGVGQPLFGTEPDVSGLWKLNEGSGRDLIDSTSNGNDGSIIGGTEGTHWEWADGHVGALVTGSHGVHLRYFSPTEEMEVFLEIQFPHRWKEGTEIYPHVHWTPEIDGVDYFDDVRWGLEYIWSDIGEFYTDTTISYANRNIYGEQLIKDKHYISSFDPLDGEGKKISSMLVCRLFRDAENVSDTYTGFAGFLEFDIHYQVDSDGSDQIFKKSF